MIESGAALDGSCSGSTSRERPEVVFEVRRVELERWYRIILKTGVDRAVGYIQPEAVADLVLDIAEAENPKHHHVAGRGATGSSPGRSSRADPGRRPRRCVRRGETARMRLELEWPHR
ncbi:hypothetical protein OB919_13220 [Halobacteria archaeon AArc-curdl1]|uniref:Uncharacterized protein n=1 Tax=Natronosalvus hydrolyticus TaxID=2979988 RepID=A0AAP2Z903_9EURY|nr:hypothetical protein [Halobacteria archaeon AArc-curdl1]